MSVRGVVAGSFRFPDTRAGLMLRCAQPQLHWNAPSTPIPLCWSKVSAIRLPSRPWQVSRQETWRRKAWPWCRSVALSRCRDSLRVSGRLALHCASAACAMLPKSGISAANWRGLATRSPIHAATLKERASSCATATWKTSSFARSDPTPLKRSWRQRETSLRFARSNGKPHGGTRAFVDQIRRFLGAGARRKLRYASLFVLALDLDRQPRPLRALLSRV